MKKILVLMLMFITAYSFSQNYSQSWTNVNYAGDGQGYHNLDIYLPAQVQESYPVVIYIYGSAWLSNSGKGADMSTVGAAFLDAGYAVVTPNHRSSSDAIFPAQINDIKAVVRFVRGTAETYGFDPSFVAVSGSSSGGHLAALTGTTNGVTTYTVGSATANIEGSLGSYTSFSSEVQAVIDFFGPTDLSVISSCINGQGFDHDSPSSPGSAIIGAPILENPDKVALLNPITYVDPTDPPFRIFHGDADQTVPYCQSELLNEALVNAGVDSDYTLISGAQHGPGVHVQSTFTTMVNFLNEVKESAVSGFALTVTGGTGSGSYEEGESVTVTATDAPEGQAFSQWGGDGASLLTDATSPTVTFTMPGRDVTLTAEYITAYTVAITSPANGSSVAAGSSVNVSVSVSMNGTSIENIEFYLGDTKLGEDNSAPYSFTWSNIPEGEPTLTVKATDTDGLVVTKSLTLNAYVPQAAFGGTPHAVPGTIEFEDFDTGGQDTAYYDDTPGSETTVTYRDGEDVDLEVCEDTGGGYNIGYSTSGEWVEYTVNVQNTGTYKLDMRLATDGDKTLSISTNGSSIANNFTVSSTGGWQSWETFTIEDIQLTAGVQVLRFTIGASNYINMNKFELTATSVVVEEGIQLTAGWNLIGSPLAGSIAIEEALSSIWSNVNIVKDMDNFHNTNGEPQFNLLNEIEFGKGYFIHVKEDCELFW